MTDYTKQLTEKEMERGSIPFAFCNEKPPLPSIMVIGIGGAGRSIGDRF